MAEPALARVGQFPQTVLGGELKIAPAQFDEVAWANA